MVHKLIHIPFSVMLPSTLITFHLCPLFDQYTFIQANRLNRQWKSSLLHVSIRRMPSTIVFIDQCMRQYMQTQESSIPFSLSTLHQFHATATRKKSFQAGAHYLFQQCAVDTFLCQYVNYLQHDLARAHVLCHVRTVTLYDCTTDIVEYDDPFARFEHLENIRLFSIRNKPYRRITDDGRVRNYSGKTLKSIWIVIPYYPKWNDQTLLDPWMCVRQYSHFTHLEEIVCSGIHVCTVNLSDVRSNFPNLKRLGVAHTHPYWIEWCVLDQDQSVRALSKDESDQRKRVEYEYWYACRRMYSDS